MQGIYVITCTVTGEQYIGQSRDIDRRWEAHRADLSAGRHTNERLTHAWETYGAEAFTLDVIVLVADADKLDQTEAASILRLQPALNVRPAAPRVALHDTAATIIPARYRIASGYNAETKKREYYVMRRDDREPNCWREIAGPYVQRGGAIQRLDRIIARGELHIMEGDENAAPG